MPSLSVVIVTHNSRAALGTTLPPLAAQLRDGDELIVVDNASADETPAAVGELAPAATLIETGSNRGFAAACNVGAAQATGELLVLLNPDAVPQPGWRDAIELPLLDGREWAAWQALVTADGGRMLNTRGGVIHFTGIAWAGGAGRALEELPASEPVALDDPGFVSGACLALPRETYLEAGGLAEEFFLYQEDVDLSLRLRLAGGQLGVEPAAQVDHDYEFAKGEAKWRYLERNRWATLIRTYPAGLLAVVMPALVLTELALIPVSIAGGWFPQKLRAWAELWTWLPRLVRERRTIQAHRRVSVKDFAEAFTAELDSSYVGRAGRSRVLGLLLRSYWSLARRLLGARG